ncbi:2-octaprenyl-6-methoxyphenyl hydroxylase [Lysobacter xinjiangensis]|uniref:2-octaprenyl-6-methoxyphenyl hydroxylase n=1 Tax=Cognatilysobacter xinjiangensis TaxID=546892 RepID=A0ABQ3C4J1_9GAMM|nr:2-octaprenyl-6-methoxyphenyl hydroxylase [Lysobacter xinjiangensis]GGZ67124.1 2-octaprenyl-6-methoxyphenyl hydroxylase [Lysobacter xinjiangensis]
MNADAPRKHDLVIVGGGLVGASLALALEPLGLDVALVDATPAGEMPPVFDERSLSFSEATVNALTALGVIPMLRAAGGPIRRIVVSREGDFGQARLDATRYGRTEFGQVVVARDFGHALEARLETMRGLTRYRPTRFVGSSIDGDVRRVTLQGTDGTVELAAPLVVGADGTASGMRAALGIGAETLDYGHALLVARLRTERAPDGTGYERLTDAGPTALLPRADRHYGLVHGVASAEVDTVEALDEAAFLARLQSRLGWRHGRLLACGPRSRYPARRVVANATTAPRAVLVGNAAQTIHPLGAQGFNLGLRDALTLAEEIAAALPQGRDALGADALLQRYAARRVDDRRRTLAFSDRLLRVGMARGALMRPLRSLALLSLDHPSWLQAWLVGGAMGYRGDVPALCRGDDARRRA